MNLARTRVLLFTILALSACAASWAADPPPGASAESTHPIRLPFGIMRFAGPANMDQAPRPRALPDQAPLLAVLEQNPDAEALIRFTVTPKGKPRKVEVTQSNDENLARLAKAFVEKIEFRPARANGRSVACEVAMPFGLH